MADLSDVPSGALMRELQRRMDCAIKPEKRIILVGESHTCCKKKQEGERLMPSQARLAAARGRSRRKSRCARPALHCLHYTASADVVLPARGRSHLRLLRQLDVCSPPPVGRRTSTASAILPLATCFARLSPQRRRWG
jgi:hypothetical protein